MNAKYDKMKELINGWNVNKYSAASRDELRRLLGWNRETDDTVTLADLIEHVYLEQIESVRSEKIREVKSAAERAHVSSEHQQALDEAVQACKDFVQNRILCLDIANTVLNSGWNFIDPKGLMHKTPHEVKDFLTEISVQVEKASEMYDTRYKLLKMILDAWIRWHLDRCGRLNSREAAE